MPITNDRTPNLDLPLPYADNMLEDDSDRLREAFTTIDTAVAGKQANLGFTAQNAAQKGAVNGYAGLDSGGKVPAAQLPSYVDDVVEAANFAALPATGDSGKIYVTLATNKTYRWGGSAYAEIASSPGSTDVVLEGAANLYHTPARALAAVPIATPVTLGKVKIGAGLGIDGDGLLFASAGGGSVMSIQEIIPGSNGVSSITVPGGYVAGTVLVGFNGALLGANDFTATNGTTIGLVGFTAGTVDAFTVIKLATVTIGSLPAGSVGTTQLADGAVTLAKTAGVAASGPNNDITSLAGLTTPLSVSQGGTGGTTGAQQPGEICHFARNTAPTGFLKANGASVSTTTYAALFSAIGYVFGGSGGSFNLPDLRGEFIRGWSDGHTTDSGRAHGSSQTDQFQGHYHNNTVYGGSGGATSATGGNGNSANSVQNVQGPITDGANGAPRTGAETRPRNIALLACIKY